MQYLITFLEGIISFISPCVLPMLPVYIIYFTGDSGIGGRRENSKARAVRNSIAFVLGFMLIFSIMGAFAGGISSLLKDHLRGLEIAGGILVIIFGLTFMGIIRISLFTESKAEGRVEGLLSAFLFGMIYSVTLTPCVGAFLGSALMMAGTSGSALKGMSLLICYSLGFGIPFVLSAMLIDQLRGAFDLIKKHYKAVNRICGLFLVAVGILMIAGKFSHWVTVLM